MQNKEVLNLANTIQGEINRICVSDDVEEINSMANWARQNIQKLFKLRYKDVTDREAVEVEVSSLKWVPVYDKNLGQCFKCEGCSKVMPVEFPYCPWCGSLMEEDK